MPDPKSEEKIDEKTNLKTSNASAVFVSIISGICYGLTMSITSGILEEDPWVGQTAFIKGFISSALLIGAAIGCLASGFFSDHFGRIRIILICSVEILICTIITSVFKNIVTLIVFRTLVGLGVGAISAVGPVYVNEQSSPNRRGMICSLLQTSTTFSIALAYTFNFSFHTINGGWRYEFALTALPPILISMRQFGIGLLASKRALIISVVLSMMQQLTGINAIIMYQPMILASMGLSDTRDQLIGTIFVGLWNFITTVFALFLVDRIGRRLLLITGYSLMSLGNFLVVLSAVIPALQQKAYYLSVPGLAVFLAGFEFGPGPLYFLVISENFPTVIRGRAMSLMTGINWACNIIMVFSYLPLVQACTIQWVYTVLFVFSIFTAIFVACILVETKNKSLEEISADSSLKLDKLQSNE
ncbi:MAG: sugar porter family MFS transporter [Streblomastix strix]|uniref:Sugar porter family MFS transporter n=1 Tax=Streblomastix strix TaxID=222440 RepID=A0A5J4W9N4_9EUKA|nr:MAG: sugar porter family MFS transporter [Streblomastix strix]